MSKKKLPTKMPSRPSVADDNLGVNAGSAAEAMAELWEQDNPTPSNVNAAFGDPRVKPWHYGLGYELMLAPGQTIQHANAPTGETEWDYDAGMRREGFTGASEGRK